MICVLNENMSKEIQSRDTYHHGNLPDVLVKEGARLLAEKGLEGFSLRQIADRTGVTVAAPSHHFGSAKGLFTAIATAGFIRLAKRMEIAAANAQSSQDAVISMCIAYFEMRVTEPGYASVMFRLDRLNANNKQFLDQAFHTFNLLKAAVAKAAPDEVEDAKIAIATKALWATTHGVIALPMIENEEAERIIRSTVGAHLAALN